MDVVIYADGIDDDQRRHLKDAIEVVGGLQNYFFPSAEIIGIRLPGDAAITAQDANDSLKRAEAAGGYKVCVTSRPFADEWFSHEYRSTSIISVCDWEQVYAPPSLTCYLVYELAQAFLAFAADLSEEMALRLVHEPPMGCIMDLCDEKKDIRHGMVAGWICTECRGIFLRLGTPTEALDSVERILRVVRAEAIGRSRPPEPSRAFVVMRFTKNDENDNAYEHGIKPGLQAVGFAVDRADSVVQSGQILDKVRRFIDKSRIVIAKVDENNLNVYFELGLAMGADKDVLLVSEEKLVLTLPSDLKNWECLTYRQGNYVELKEKVSGFLEAKYRLQRPTGR